MVRSVGSLINEYFQERRINVQAALTALGIEGYSTSTLTPLNSSMEYLIDAMMYADLKVPEYMSAGVTSQQLCEDVEHALCLSAAQLPTVARTPEDALIIISYIVVCFRQTRGTKWVRQINKVGAEHGYDVVFLDKCHTELPFAFPADFITGMEDDELQEVMEQFAEGRRDLEVMPAMSFHAIGFDDFLGVCKQVYGVQDTIKKQVRMCNLYGAYIYGQLVGVAAHRIFGTNVAVNYLDTPKTHSAVYCIAVVPGCESLDVERRFFHYIESTIKQPMLCRVPVLLFPDWVKRVTDMGFTHLYATDNEPSDVLYLTKEVPYE